MIFRAFLCLAASAAVGLCASLQQVTSFGTNPTRISMYIYVPDKLAEKPAIVVSMHACGGNAQGQFRGNRVQSYADQLGFILIVPSTPNMSNCWDVQSPGSLTHGQGGDALGIVSMVNYTLDKYKGDRDRVYMFGVSSGGMMANVLAGSYPDVFEAGAAYSGTAFACFAGAPQATPMAPNQTCAQGLQHTPDEWAAFVRNAYPGYTGRRTRMQIWHGLADGLVRPQCAVEALKQWSKVLDLPLAKNNTATPSAAYTQQMYGDGSKLQGYFGQGVGHIAPVNEVYMLRFFGLLQ